jgi:hypothetical protein
VDASTGTVIWSPSKGAIAEYYAQLEADRIRVGAGRASEIAVLGIYR